MTIAGALRGVLAAIDAYVVAPTTVRQAEGDRPPTAPSTTALHAAPVVTDKHRLAAERALRRMGIIP